MHVLFLDQTEPVEASVKKLGEHLIQISGTGVNLSGFHLLNSAGNVFGKYDGFRTLYKEEDGSYTLSNDGSVYIEPVEPEPTPIPINALPRSFITVLTSAKSKLTSPATAIKSEID